MAQLVIHPLEMVDVHEEQGQALVLGADCLQPAGKVGQEIVLVLQTGERVDELARELFPQGLLQELVGIPSPRVPLPGPCVTVLRRRNDHPVARLCHEASRIVQKILVDLCDAPEHLHERHLGLARYVAHRFPKPGLDPPPDLAGDRAVFGGPCLRLQSKIHDRVLGQVFRGLPPYRIFR